MNTDPDTQRPVEFGLQRGVQFVESRPGADPLEDALFLRITLLANDRDHHGTTSIGSFKPEIQANGESLVVTIVRLFSLTIRAPGGDFAVKGDWYSDFDLTLEAERGLD